MPSTKRSLSQSRKKPKFRREWNSEREIHPGSYAHPSFQLDLQEKNSTLESEKTRKIKVAMLVAYIGTDFGGFQINEGKRTIQAELELALFKAHLISKSNFGAPSKYSWSTSGRTDKGVHACAQVCSCKIESNTLPSTHSINQHLPQTIRILDIQRVTRSFCAKQQRDRVQYQYMIPSFVLQPQHTNHQTFRISQTQLETLQNTLQAYVGTKSYHNFSSRVESAAQAKRYILSFSVSDPVILHDTMEWIPTHVLGQAFLMHQIRKMVHMAILVTRGDVPQKTLLVALSDGTVVNLKTAPAQGLFLEQSFYEGYNHRKNTQNQELPDIVWNETHTAAFQRKIQDHIAQQEIQEGNYKKYHEYLAASDTSELLKLAEDYQAKETTMERSTTSS